VPQLIEPPIVIPRRAPGPPEADIL